MADHKSEMWQSRPEIVIAQLYAKHKAWELPVPDTFKIMRRKGKFTDVLHGAPEFADRLEAEKWARAYQKRHDDEFPRGSIAIEVAPVHHVGND